MQRETREEMVLDCARYARHMYEKYRRLSREPTKVRDTLHAKAVAFLLDQYQCPVETGPVLYVRQREILAEAYSAYVTGHIHARRRTKK